MGIADRDHLCDGGKACMAALQAPVKQRETDRRNVGTADGGNSSRLSYVRQPGSLAQRSSDVNAAKHNGRQTDAHTSPRTEHISACQSGPRGLREVRVAEPEQADSLSMLLTTR